MRTPLLFFFDFRFLVPLQLALFFCFIVCIFIKTKFGLNLFGFEAFYDFRFSRTVSIRVIILFNTFIFICFIFERSKQRDI